MHPKTHKRNVHLHLTRLWYQELSRRIALATGRRPTASEVGELFFTSDTLSQELNTPEKDKECENIRQVNTNFWYRIENGLYRIKDKGLINRIEQIFEGTKIILECPLSKILTNPLTSNRELDELLEKLAPSVKKRIFNNADNYLAPNECYFGEKTFHLLNNKDFLAYQLILIRKQALKKFSQHPYLSIEKTTFLLLRVLMTTPLGKIADSILFFYFHFLLNNVKDLNIKIDQIEAHYLKKNPLPYVIDLCFPKIIRPSFMASFMYYKNYHDELLTKGRYCKYGDESFISDEHDSIILYWADHYSDLWFSNNIEKIDLFTPKNTIFEKFYTNLIGPNKRHRIW